MERHGANPALIGPAPGPGNWLSAETVKEMNKNGKIKKNLKNPPLKDNVSVPDAGFTILRFLADNVGYWLFHCHMSWHNHLGMGVVIKVSIHQTNFRFSNVIILISKVGDVEESIQPAPRGFPRCGDFVGCEDF